jgi:UDP-N-acetylglucosamine:LPS N-acetylglucosamine transferase
MKVCLAASAGGHLNQLLQTAAAWRRQRVFFVTTGNMPATRLWERCGAKVYEVGGSNRQHLPKVLQVLARCVGTLVQEQPDVVISTGAAHGCLLCLLGKLLGAKVVRVDSIANVERLSRSGRLVPPLANLVMSQWPEVAARYRRVEYHRALMWSFLPSVPSSLSTGWSGQWTKPWGGWRGKRTSLPRSAGEATGSRTRR